MQTRITGAYYSARLAVAEHLKRIRRQASAIVFREITPEYKIPMGFGNKGECSLCLVPKTNFFFFFRFSFGFYFNQAEKIR